MLQDLIRNVLLEGFQVFGKVLDLSRNDRADGKDTTHTQRLAETPCRQRFVHPWINTGQGQATSEGHPSEDSLIATSQLVA